MQYEIQNQTKEFATMKITNIASVAEKIIATVVFALLITVLSIKDYPTKSMQSPHDKTEVTASINHHTPVVE